MAHTSSASLDVPAARALDGFERSAQALGLTTERNGDGLRLTLRLGTVDISGDGSGTRISIASDSAARLQSLRDMLADRVGQMGVDLAWQAQAGGRPANLSLGRIDSIERVSPAFVRVVISGDDLGRFATGGMHFRLLLGPEGAGWPEIDAGGLTQWPGGPDAWHRPVYTTRAIKPLGGGAARITFDIFLHEGGRVTDWVLAAKPGEEIALTGPGGSDQPCAGWLGLVCDETAVPVAARILACAPETQRGKAILFVPQAEDIQEIAHPKGVGLQWVVRGDGPAPVEALEGLDVPVADRFVFFAAERQEAMQARQMLTVRGFTRKEFLAAAYWTR